MLLLPFISISFSLLSLVSSTATSSPKMLKPEVVVVGSTMMDLVANCPKLPTRGETVFGSTFQKNFGGKGSNQAVMCARLGTRVTHVGQIGTDSLGDEYLAQLVAEGVETKYMRRSTNGKSTGIAVINVETSSGANTIVIIPGANDDLTISDGTDQELIQHIQDAKVLITQNEIPRMTTLKALHLAQAGTQTVSIFNPAPVSDGLAELIAVSDIVVPNETELAALTSLPTTTDAEIETAAQKLLSMGCQCCITTLGENGAFVIVNDGSPGIFLRTSSVKAVDSTGAGDSFIGTLASNLTRGSSLLQAVKNALHCASISVTRAGAQKSYARLEEIDEQYRPLSWSNTSPPFNKKSIFRL